MFVFSLISIFKTWVAELQEVHYNTYRKRICKFSRLRFLFINLRTGLHACAWNVLRTVIFDCAYKPVISNANDKLLVEEYIFRFEVIMTIAVLLEPRECVDQLTHDDPQGWLTEIVGVLQLVEQFPVADVLHFQLWVQGARGETIFSVEDCWLFIVWIQCN